MDPVTIIISALATGIASAAEATAGTAVKDAYEGLKALIKSKFGGDADAEAVLEKHAGDTETWDKPLRKALSDAGLEQDKAVLEAAQELLKQADPEGAAKGKYSLQVSGNVQGLVQGDHNQVSMQFGSAPTSDKD